MEPIKLRGHHLFGVVNVYSRTREAHTRQLITCGYIPDEAHPFAGVYDQIKEIFNDPNNRILLVAGVSDFICGQCPKRFPGQDLCNEEPELNIGAFLPDPWRIHRDKEVIFNCGLKIGTEYSVGDLREKLGLTKLSP